MSARKRLAYFIQGVVHRPRAVRLLPPRRAVHEHDEVHLVIQRSLERPRIVDVHLAERPRRAGVIPRRDSGAFLSYGLHTTHTRLQILFQSNFLLFAVPSQTIHSHGRWEEQLNIDSHRGLSYGERQTTGGCDIFAKAWGTRATKPFLQLFLDHTQA